MNKDTIESKLATETDFANKFFVEPSFRYIVNVAGTSHIGKRRSRNEDHFAITRRTRRRELLATNLPAELLEFDCDEAYGLLIADGIGGAKFGDIASQLALETALEACGLATSWLMKFRDMDAQQVKQRVAAYIERIQERFQAYGNIYPAAQEMGTTLTCAYLMAPHAIIVQIGDSRAYLFREGKLTQLTKDQTLAQLLMDEGVDHEHASSFGHVLINSIGANADHVDSEVLHLEMKHNDRLLLCTDGLSDMVDDDSIANVLSQNGLDESCERLVELALKNGGRDNITIVIGELLDRAQTSTREFPAKS